MERNQSYFDLKLAQENGQVHQGRFGREKKMLDIKSRSKIDKAIADSLRCNKSTLEVSI
jgi:hypothetical protein